MALLDDLDRRRERAERDRENSARLAQSYAEFTTEGIGTIQHKKRVDFGLTFIEKPFMSYGSTVDIDALADVFVVEDEDLVKLPITAGFVTEWDQDERDFYVGCWVAVRVFYPDTELIIEGGPAPEDLKPEIGHHFTFAGNAMKDVSVDKLE